MGAVAVGKLHVLKFKSTLYHSGAMAAGRLYFALGLQYAEKAFGIDQRIVQVIVDAVQLADRRANVAEQQHVVHNLTNGHAWIVN